MLLIKIIIYTVAAFVAFLLLFTLFSCVFVAGASVKHKSDVKKWKSEHPDYVKIRLYETDALGTYSARIEVSYVNGARPLFELGKERTVLTTPGEQVMYVQHRKHGGSGDRSTVHSRRRERIFRSHKESKLAEEQRLRLGTPITFTAKQGGEYTLSVDFYENVYKLTCIEGEEHGVLTFPFNGESLN